MENKKLIIIGSGPAAYTAAIYSARANLNPLLIEGPNPGGQLMGTSNVENWPGEIKILGPELMKKMKEQAKQWGTTMLDQEVTSVDVSKRPFVITTNKNNTLQAQALIIATGAVPRKLGCPGEQEYWGKGVTTCAVCDGAFYKDKKVVVLGGGDTSMEDASFLTKFTNDITVIHIGDKLTASAAMQKRILENKNIKVIYNSTITEFKGDGEKLTSIIVQDKKNNKTTQMSADGVFLAIGLNPKTEIFKGQLELEKSGHIKVTDHVKTSVAGVFAAGDVADFKYRQAITSAGTGCMAALEVERFLSNAN